MDALIQVVVTLVIAGVLLWGLSQFEIDAAIYKLIRVAVIVVATIYVLYVLVGLAGHPHGVLVH